MQAQVLTAPVPAVSVKPKKLEENIIEIVSGYFGEETNEFKTSVGRKISAELAYKKHLCYFLIRQYTFVSDAEIGKIFNTSRETIRSGVVKVQNLHNVNHRYITDIKRIKKLIDTFIEQNR